MSEGRTINRQRVAWSLRRYRWVAYLVILANAFLVYLLALFFLRTALPSFLLTIGVLICIFWVARKRPITYSSDKDPDIQPIDVVRYGWVVELWRARCKNYDMKPGPVFVTKTGEEAADARFVTQNWSLEHRHPAFYVGELCLPLLRPEIIEPIVEHELGHHRLMATVMRRFFLYVSAPGTFLLSIFSAQRRRFEQVASNAVEPCWFLERLLFWSSRCALQQYEEYAADALMAEAINDEDRSVGALATVHCHLTGLGLRPPSLRNSHLDDHLPLDQRIKAIQKLFT